MKFLTTLLFLTLSSVSLASTSHNYTCNGSYEWENKKDVISFKLSINTPKASESERFEVVRELYISDFSTTEPAISFEHSFDLNFWNRNLDGNDLSFYDFKDNESILNMFVKINKETGKGIFRSYSMAYELPLSCKAF